MAQLTKEHLDKALTKHFKKVGQGIVNVNDPCNSEQIVNRPVDAEKALDVSR